MRKSASNEKNFPERWQNAVIQAIGEGLATMESDGQIIFANAELCKIFAYTEGQLEGKNIGLLIHEERISAITQGIFGRALKADGRVITRRMELIGLKRDGTEFPLEIRFEKIIAPEESNEYFVTVMRDISERKNVEEALMEARAEAIIAKESAEKFAMESADANRAKSEFLANMSHELRTPLNGILGFTEILLDSDIRADHRRKLELIRFSGDTLLTLVNDILDLATIEAGKFCIGQVEFDLLGLIETISEQYAFRAQEKGIELVLDVAEDVPEILTGDPIRLRQVLWNLLGNALKFTADGQVSLRVALESETEDMVTLHFYVKDTGVGIPTEKQKNIFERFTQADSSMTRKYEGAGLGTTISKQLVELMGGSIWLESEEGAGSLFHFTAELLKQNSQVSQKERKSGSLTQYTVLLTCSDTSNLDSLRHVVQSFGMKTEVANDYETALDILKDSVANGKKSNYDFCLVDLIEPEGDQMKVNKVVDKIREICAVKIILVLPKQKYFSSQYLEPTIDKLLVKPIKGSELYEAFISVINFETGESAKKSANGFYQGADGKPITLKILLVEDNPISQEVSLSALEQIGHRVTLAENGNEAIEKWEKGDFDLILMDVQMPGMDGFETTTVIREKEKAQGGHIPIIATTARAMTGDMEKCITAGMDSYLSKPLSLSRLREKLNIYFGTGSNEVSNSDDVLEDRDSNALYDLEYIRTLLRNDEEKVKKFLRMFVTSSEKNISGLEAAVESEDAYQVQFIAHDIKGSAAELGAQSVRELARRLEVMGGKKNLADAHQTARSLAQAYHELKQKLNEEL